LELSEQATPSGMIQLTARRSIARPKAKERVHAVSAFIAAGTG
jgi:hypothetical protein